MTQEDKQLLLKDLCARLPYGVKVRIESDWFYDEREPYDTALKSEVLGHLIADVYSVKPYLRPKSSIAELINAKEWSSLGGIDLIDWYNANHIDYRDLIPLGLALEASEDMYK